MQCPFCGMENSAWTCASCKKPASTMSQQETLGKAVNERNSHINSPAAVSLMNLGLCSRIERLSKVSHLTVPTTQPIGNPAHLAKGSAPRRQAVAGNADGRKELGFASDGDINQTFPYLHPAYGGSENHPVGPQFAQPRQKASSSGSFFSQAALVIGVFALGAVTGLGVTWWLKESAATMQPRPQPSAETARINGAANDPANESAASATSATGATGMNPDELPYDGLASRQAGGIDASQAMPPLPQLSIKAPAAATSTATGELPNEGASGASGTTRGGSDEAISRSLKSPNKARRETAAAAEAPGKKASIAAQAQTDETKAAKVPQRRGPSQRIAKDKEIERIKRQADEELKKKTENRRQTVETPARAKEKKLSMQAASASSSSIASGGRQARLARCAQASNFIRREQCKWQVCNGMWGKEGCPSYEKQANANY